ncbi:MAG: flavodoxin family protein [Candidatus Bathyarchaeota archaeon]|nr:flavodoxin family protein [Candidatus Bathyarchaeota archaeon]
MKILGLVGSQRKGGNSYLILKEAIKCCNEEVEIVQLAEMRIDWCNACGLCKDTMKCVIEDDVGFIFDKIIRADAVIFSVPRYLPVPSKFMALIERIGALYHYKLEADAVFHLPLEGKPFGLVVVSAGGGRQAFEALKEIAFQIIHCWHMKLITTDSYPYLGVLAQGEEVSQVLEDKKAIEQVRELIKKLMM